MIHWRSHFCFPDSWVAYFHLRLSCWGWGDWPFIVGEMFVGTVHWVLAGNFIFLKKKSIWIDIFRRKALCRINIPRNRAFPSGHHSQWLQETLRANARAAINPHTSIHSSRGQLVVYQHRLLCHSSRAGFSDSSDFFAYNKNSSFWIILGTNKYVVAEQSASSDHSEDYSSEPYPSGTGGVRACSGKHLSIFLIVSD